MLKFFTANQAQYADTISVMLTIKQNMYRTTNQQRIAKSQLSFLISNFFTKWFGKTRKLDTCWYWKQSLVYQSVCCTVCSVWLLCTISNLAQKLMDMCYRT